MIDKSTLLFLKQLQKNNYREWFHEHKPEYDAARQNILDNTAELLQEIHKFDHTIALTEPRKCLYRIARDTRFAADKTPYKSNFGIIMNPDGSTRSIRSGYYLNIEPGNCFVSCGMYMLSPDILKTVRIYIDERWDALAAILQKKTFRDTFGSLVRDDDALSRVPTSFDKNSPAADVLKLKRFYIWVSIRPNEAILSKDFLKKITAYYRLMQPLNTFLNEAIMEM
jgi:uncharacterized protein (TIGR02453 family)